MHQLKKNYTDKNVEQHLEEHFNRTLAKMQGTDKKTNKQTKKTVIFTRLQVNTAVSQLIIWILWAL